VLGAVQEVDQAIAGYNAEQNRLINLSRARSAALDAVRLSTDRYERGPTDFLNVLDAERGLRPIRWPFLRSLVITLFLCGFQNAGADILLCFGRHHVGPGSQQFRLV
jgi:hypothetical protein